MLHAVMFAAMLGTAAAAPAPAAKSGVQVANADKRICKRVDNSASRIKTSKLCLTKAEWDEMDRENRQEWEDRGSTGR